MKLDNYKDIRTINLTFIAEVGDPKAPFSIAATPRCRGERYSFPWIVPFYSWFVLYNAEF